MELYSYVLFLTKKVLISHLMIVRKNVLIILIFYMHNEVIFLHFSLWFFSSAFLCDCCHTYNLSIFILLIVQFLWSSKISSCRSRNSDFCGSYAILVRTIAYWWILISAHYWLIWNFLIQVVLFPTLCILLFNLMRS